MSQLHTHQLLAAQTHRRMIDPMSLGRRTRPFVIERVPHASDASPASPPSPSAAVVEAGRSALTAKARG